jgi:hypothetical protein
VSGLAAGDYEISFHVEGEHGRSVASKRIGVGSDFD